MSCSPITIPYEDINSMTPGGTWTSSDDPLAPLFPLPPATYDGSINFSTSKLGTVTYTYTVTNGDCSDSKSIQYTVRNHTPVSNDTCATARVLAFPYSGGTGGVDNQDLRCNCPGHYAPTLSATTLPAGWGNPDLYKADLWYKVQYDAPYAGGIGLPIAMTLSVDGVPYSTNGIKEPVIAMYSDCDTLEAIETGEANLQQVDLIVTDIFTSSFTKYIRVSAREGDEGKFNMTITV